MKYSFDISLFIKRFLPGAKRAVNHIEWLEAIHDGAQYVHNEFVAFKDDTLKTLSYNSQTLLLEKALNDNFDNTARRIYIDNTADNLEESFGFRLSESDEDGYAWRLSESPATPNYTYRLTEYENPYDFTVYVPNDLINQKEAIAVLVDLYKLAGKRYIIILF